MVNFHLPFTGVKEPFTGLYASHVDERAPGWYLSVVESARLQARMGSACGRIDIKGGTHG